VEIAERIGTPVYIYSTATILRHLKLYEEAFKGIPHLFCYSVKANSNLAILTLIAKQGWGADVVSGGELYKALKAGFSPSRIVYAGVGKTEEEIRFALKSDILLLNVESFGELQTLNRVASQLKTRARVSLRLNPEVKSSPHAYISTGAKETKFGIPFEEASKIIKRREEFVGIEILGLHLHIGSQITEISPYREAIEKTLNFLEEVRKVGFRPLYLDMGGGMGIIYSNEEPFTPEEFSSFLSPYIERENFTLILEPGRFIVGNAGVLLTRVLYLKRVRAKNFLIVDAGMNDLLRPALYHAYHEVLPVVPRKGEKETFDIVGPVCESGDFLALNRALPPVKEGDLLAVMSAGAYGFSMASNYNSRPRPAEVLVEGGKFFLVGRRETYRDLVRLEAIPPHLQEPS